MVRGFLRDGPPRFEDRCDVDSEAMDVVIEDLAKKHGKAMADGRLGMIEIEFLDEQDQNARFFRIGVDPTGMVNPMRINLEKPN
jgi:hypothetical protein